MTDPANDVDTILREKKADLERELASLSAEPVERGSISFG